MIITLFKSTCDIGESFKRDEELFNKYINKILEVECHAFQNTDESLHKRKITDDSLLIYLYQDNDN